jgi:hypothetical protein
METKKREWEERKISKIFNIIAGIITLLSLASLIVGVRYFFIGILLTVVFLFLSRITSTMKSYSSDFVNRILINFKKASSEKELLELKEYIRFQALNHNSIRLTDNTKIIHEILKGIETKLELLYSLQNKESK